MASRPPPLEHPAIDRAARGRAGEDRAVQWLEDHGAKILLRNFRARCGELDIVALDGAVIAIVEVRCRSSRQWGGSAASVDASKQQRIRRTTQLLLQRHPSFAKRPLRFDVVAIDGHGPHSIEWIRHAFVMN